MDVNGVNVTANGSTELGTTETKDVLVSVSGDLGGGVLSLEGWSSSLAKYLSLAEFTERTQTIMSVGKGAKLRLTMANVGITPDADVGFFELRE